MIATTKRPRRARGFHAGVEGLDGRRLLTGGGQYIGGGWNPGNWGVLGAIGGAYDSVAGGLAEVPGTIY